MRTHTNTAPLHIAAHLDQVHASLVERIDHLLRVADLAIDLGLVDVAEEAIADATPLIAQRRSIEACWVAR